MKKITRSNIACFICGIVIANTVGAIAATYTASENPFTVKVNNQDVEMEGYNIDGSTYFKLRDIGDRTGFEVGFENDTILIADNSTNSNGSNKNLYEGKNVLVLGDSNSALSGTELTDSSADWKHWFKEYTNPKSLNCVAVGGATLCDKENTVYDGNPAYNAEDQSGNCFGNQVQKVINNAYEAPDIIIVLYGMNDGATTLTDETIEVAFMKTYTGLENVPLSEVDRTTFSGAFRYVNETLRNLYPEAVIVACTPIQQSQGARTYYKIQQTADSIEKLARRMSLPLWDTGGESGIYTAYDNYGTGSAYDLGDGLHTNGYGARKLGRYMAQKFIGIFGFEQ